jgi:amidophosphoribosyltransferase
MPCVAEIAGYGVLAFRDPFGIRPLCYGVAETDTGTEYLVASESVALEGLGFRMVRDVMPGEACSSTSTATFIRASAPRTRR